jgi:MinD-like ATPase involved in chromosome partitioning or flagellar assembly
MLVRDALRLGFAGSTAVARDLVAADEGLRRPVSTSRRIAVVQAHGGAGATTVTAGVASVLAGRRAAGVLAVDAAHGRAALAAACGVPTPLGWAVGRARTAGIVRAEQARGSLPRTPGGLAVLGDGSASAPWPPQPRTWREVVDPVGRFFDVVLTDWGVREPTELAVVAGDHHVVVVVARADRADAERGVALATHVAAAEVRAPAVVLLLVDVGGTGGPSATPARGALAEHGVTVRTVPHDAALGAGGTSPGTDVRTAFSTLGAHLLTLACDPHAALTAGDAA